jgi:hypothetical protein
MPLWFSSEKMVKFSAYTESVTPNQHIDVSFDTEALDLGGFFNPGQPTRLTIPVKLGGWYQVFCTVRWVIPEFVSYTHDPDQEASSYFYTWLKRNNAVMSNEARSTTNRVTGSKGSSQVMAMETHFDAGDVVNLVLWHNFDTNYIQQINALSFLSLHRIKGGSLTVSPNFVAAKLTDEKNIG